MSVPEPLIPGPDPGHPADRPAAVRRALATAAALVALGLALRLLAARGSLWMDEILSLGLATSAAHAWDLVARVHHDNNHVLNSLWMRAVGEGASPLLHRLPGVVSGAIAVALAAAWRWPASRQEGLIAAALCAVSLPLVQQGSEARGYGVAVAATLAAVVLARRAEESGRCTWAAAYWLAALVGLLSHLGSLFVLAGLCAWAGLRASVRGTRRESLLLLQVHGVPALTGLAAWLGMAKDMTIAGGPPARFPAAVAALSHVAAGPSEGLAAWGVAAGVVSAIVLGLIVLARRADPDAGLVALCAVVVPASVVVVLRPEYLAPRYFLLPTALVCAPLAALFGEALRARPPIRSLGAVALGLVLVAHLFQDARVVLTGRGDGPAALRFVQQHAAGPDLVTLGANNDFRLHVLLWHSRRSAGSGPTIVHVRGSRTEVEPPEWLLTEEFRDGVTPPGEQAIRGGARYGLEAVFPHAGVSGITWGVYRRVSPP